MSRKFSYTYEVKTELARFFVDDTELLRAELIAMLASCAIVGEERIDFFHPHAAVTRRVFKLIKKTFHGAKIEVAAVRTKVLRKTMKYAVRIFLTNHTENLFNDLCPEEILNNPDLGVAYLRGAFLSSGSVNRPEKRNHLEITFVGKTAAEFAKKIFKVFDMNAGIYERKGLFVVYLKEGDAICDFLAIIGAEKAVERFEVARNVKEVRAMVNRIVNCETANLSKAVDAAQKQIADIQLIQSKGIEVEEHIQKAMEFRLKYPADSTKEIAAKMYLSKQGFLYRMKVIHELAESIKENDL